jgi:hypothetical protein
MTALNADLGANLQEFRMCLAVFLILSVVFILFSISTIELVKDFLLL